MDSDERSVDSDEGSEEVPWEKLRDEAMEELSSSLEKKLREYQKNGASEELAKKKAYKFLLPAFRKRLNRTYLHYIKWYRTLKWNSVDKEIMETLRCFMAENDMEFQEALEAAVDKRNSFTRNIRSHNQNQNKVTSEKRLKL